MSYVPVPAYSSAPYGYGPAMPAVSSGQQVIAAPPTTYPVVDGGSSSGAADDPSSLATATVPLPQQTPSAGGGNAPTPQSGGAMTKQDYLSEFFNGSENIDEFHPRTLYVGNLEVTVTEEFLVSIFAQMGTVNKCKIIHETSNEPYAFIEFSDHNSAVQALTAMNRRMLLGKEMRVNWATSPGTQVKVDTSKHFHAFVGDLSPEIDNKSLRDAFAAFGEISDVKVIRDLQTLKSKGYGFVSFVRREDAERAIEQMNGQWLGRRTIRTNWATRRPGGIVSHDANGIPLQNPPFPTKDYHQNYHQNKFQPRNLTFDEVMNQTSAQNCSVYVGGINADTTEEDIRKYFAKYGTVMDIKCFKQQGFCFVRFDNKESAAHAIVNVSGTEINGSAVRCSWGKEGAGGANNATLSNYGYGYNYNTAAATAQNYGAAANYWSQLYYSNPAMYQQWAANYYQQYQQQPQAYPQQPQPPQ